MFETPGPNANGEITYPFYPHPYVVEPPNADSFFHITLFGKGIIFYDEVINAIVKMGKNGLSRERIRFSPEVFSEGHKVYSEGLIHQEPSVKTLQDYLESKPPAGKRWEISFNTPVRIVHKGKLSRRFSIEGMVSSLLRRLQLLSKFHQGTEFDLPAAADMLRGVEVEQEQTHLIRQTRFSQRQKRRISFHGFVGRVVLSGGSKQLWDLLVVGEVIHVGKTTSFGYGSYKIKEV